MGSRPDITTRVEPNPLCLDPPCPALERTLGHVLQLHHRSCGDGRVELAHVLEALLEFFVVIELTLTVDVRLWLVVVFLTLTVDVLLW